MPNAARVQPKLLSQAITEVLLEPVNFAMERGMLLGGIRQRAEHVADVASPPVLAPALIGADSGLAYRDIGGRHSAVRAGADW
jgi:hypothetical protein